MLFTSPTNLIFWDSYKVATLAELNGRNFNDLRTMLQRTGITTGRLNKVTVINNIIMFRNLVNNLVNPISTVQVTLGAMVYTARHLFGPGRFQGFTDGVGDNLVQAYTDHIAGAGMGNAAPVMGDEPPGLGAGVAPLGLVPPGAGVVPLGPAPAGFTLPTATRTVQIDIASAYNDSEANRQFLNHAASTNIYFNLNGVFDVETQPFEHQILRDTQMKDLQQDDIILVTQPSNSVFVNMNQDVFKTLVLNAFVVSCSAGTVVFHKVGAIGTGSIPGIAGSHMISPQRVDAQRADLRNGCLTVSRQGHMSKKILSDWRAATLRTESALVQGKHVVSHDNLLIPVSSGKQRTEATKNRVTLCTRIIGSEHQTLFAPGRSWVESPISSWKSIIDAVTKEQEMQVSVIDVLHNQSIISSREIKYLHINANQFEKLISEYNFLDLEDFCNGWNKSLTMAEGKQLVITALRNIEHWMTANIGVQWYGLFKPLVDQLAVPTADEREWGHSQYYIQYFNIQIQEKLSRALKMLATNNSSSFDRFLNARTEFTDQSTSVRICQAIIKQLVVPLAYQNQEYALTFYIQRTHSILKQPATTRPPVGIKRHLPSNNSSIQSSPTTSSHSSRSSTPVRLVSPKPSTAIKQAKILTKKPGNVVKFAKHTLDGNDIAARGGTECFKHFLAVIGAKDAKGQSFKSCNAKQCPFIHADVPNDKNGRTAMANLLFANPSYRHNLKRAQVAIESN